MPLCPPTIDTAAASKEAALYQLFARAAGRDRLARTSEARPASRNGRRKAPGAPRITLDQFMSLMIEAISLEITDDVWESSGRVGPQHVKSAWEEASRLQSCRGAKRLSPMYHGGACSGLAHKGSMAVRLGDARRVPWAVDAGSYSEQERFLSFRGFQCAIGLLARHVYSKLSHERAEQQFLKDLLNSRSPSDACVEIEGVSERAGQPAHERLAAGLARVGRSKYGTGRPSSARRVKSARGICRNSRATCVERPSSAERVMWARLTYDQRLLVDDENPTLACRVMSSRDRCTYCQACWSYCDGHC